MSRSYLAVATAVLVLGFATHAGATNVLSNPGFETGGFDPWFPDRSFAGVPPGPGWSVASSSIATPAHSGDFFATVGDQFELRQNFVDPVPVSAIGSITFWANVVPTDPADAAIMGYDLFYSDSTDTFGMVGLDGSSNWQSFDVAGSLVPGEQLVGISFFGFSPGTAQLDDVAVNAPEPMSLAMLGFSIFGLGIIRRGR